MLFRTLALTAAVVLAPSAYAASSSALTDAARHSDDDARSEAKAQVDFGIKAAQAELWKEATYRWEKATELDPTYAEAWNNLAIGYEYQGRFEDAEAAYQRALKLEPKSVLIRQNYDLFNEINLRTQRRRDR
jgi:Tfp pilus assembly protein PilF